uniref:Uncharacterized protein n=1 Tax=Trypanosoma vivax (strain Y486) TaxID=1055687 RepID=G0U0X9_TRYVY|nr:conserved hypothetical protein [Trypanosoma vivax Y486]
MGVVPVPVLLLVLAAATAVGGKAANHTLHPRRAERVSGQQGVQKTVDGLANTSLLNEPRALCRGLTDDMIIVGGNSKFRAYSRSRKEMTTLFGTKRQGSNTKDGNYSVATVDKPSSCTRGSVGGKPMVYFVEETTKSLRYFDATAVGSHTSSVGGALSAVTLYQNDLYVTDETQNKVLKCSTSADGKPAGCSNFSTSVCDLMKPSAIAVTAQGVFVVGQNRTASAKHSLCWLGMSGGSQVVSTLDGPFTDVFATESGKLYAASETQLFSIAADSNGKKLTKTHFAGSDEHSQVTTEGEKFALGAVSRLLVLSEHEMYVVSNKLHTMHALVKPPVVLQLVYKGRPFPVSFNDSAIREAIVANMTSAINKALGTTDTVVDPQSIRVDPETWETHFSVIVQQSYFNATTEPVLRAMSFPSAVQLSDEYHGGTNVLVHMDSTLVPYCDEASLDTLRRRVAGEAARLLKFQHIYADMPAEADAANNITVIKLLLPASLDNNATSALLAEADLTAFAHAVAGGMRGAGNSVNVTIVSTPFDVPVLDEQQRRWFVHDAVLAQLEECRELASGEGGLAVGDAVTGNSSAGGSIAAACKSTVSNATNTQNPDPPFEKRSDYTVYLSKRYDFNVSACVDGIDWLQLEHKLTNTSTEVDAVVKSACGRGCIIALAITTALIVSALVVAVVVLTSKRRRLAAVVAPSRPKFTSTLDEDEADFANQ